MIVRECEKAIAEFGITLENDPKSSRMYQDRGDAYLYEAEYDKAISDYNRPWKQIQSQLRRCMAEESLNSVGMIPGLHTEI